MPGRSDILISRVLDQALELVPGGCALIINDRSYSYEKLETESDILAARFTKAGLRHEPIAFMLPNGFEIVITYLACLKSGAIAMPLNRRYAPREVYRALVNSEAKCLIIERDRLDLLENLDLDKTSLEKIYAVVIQESTDYPTFRSLLENPLAFDVPVYTGKTPAVIFYTSGSTGEPKGVVHTHGSVKGIIDSTADAFQGVTTDDVILVQEPQCHISGFMETFTVLAHGGTVVVEDRFDIDSYVSNLVDKRPTLITTHVDIILQLLDSGLCTEDTFSSLRGMYTGGDDLPSALQKRFLDLTGKPVQLGYGMTEAIWLTVARKAVFDRRGYIGKAVNGAELMIVDNDGNELPPGEAGEIWVRGPMVMSHYWKNEKVTRESFSDGWFKTGDCAVKDEDGSYYYTGRIKNIIIRKTSNIYPGEVEEALYRNPAVKEAAVIGVPDKKEGHVPVAFVVPKEGEKLTEEGLIEFTKGEIAAYKTPARIYFIESMPLTTSGKIDHKKLYELLPD